MNVALEETYHTPATLRATIQQAKNDSFALTLVGTTLPLSALIVGFVLLVTAVLLRRRGELRGIRS
jgi:hypothetical protein